MQRRLQLRMARCTQEQGAQYVVVPVDLAKLRRVHKGQWQWPRCQASSLAARAASPPERQRCMPASLGRHGQEANLVSAVARAA